MVNGKSRLRCWKAWVCCGESRSRVVVTNTIERFPDVVGRSVACDMFGNTFDTPDANSYLYNTRSELTNATAAVDSDYRYGYNFDDIGNRETSSERGMNVTYAANQLNQYTAVDDFTPVYDADGNQTVVKTSTGIWNIVYNGENRPILWTQGTNTISMSYDRMGRRVTKNDQRFVYNGYLCIKKIDDSATAHSSLLPDHYFIWDPTEPVATRPLAWLVVGENSPTSQPSTSQLLFYTHDGNKNVSEVVDDNGEVSAHYEYAPFGSILVTIGECASANPWRFSSEYAEDDSATVYYNYRHFNTWFGRWCCADPIGDVGGLNSYLLCRNMVTRFVDCIGLFSSFIIETHQNIVQAAIDDMIKDGDVMCLADAKRRRQIVEYLKYTNAKMDSKYSDDKYLEMHFNRIKGDHDEYKAIVSYTNYLWTWDTKIESFILKGGNDGCRSALRSLGELTHMLQDYYGHGVSFDYNDGDVDIEIGYAVGDPYNPLMKPSDYNGYVGGSEHGRIWDSEPGIRAPDGPANPHLPITWDYDVGRLGMAKEETKKAFKNYLRKWCEKCCKARIPLVGRARPRSPHSGRRH